MVIAGLAAAVSIAVAWFVPRDLGVGLLMTSASIVAVPAGIGACFAFWPYIREPFVVFANFAGVGLVVAYVIGPDIAFARTAGCAAGIAGCVSWIIIVGNGRWHENVNWLLAGAAAGALCHPLLFLLPLLSRESTFPEFLIYSCFGLFFYGLHTVSAGLLAATLTRIVLPMLFQSPYLGRPSFPSSAAGCQGIQTPPRRRAEQKKGTQRDAAGLTPYQLDNQLPNHHGSGVCTPFCAKPLCPPDPRLPTTRHRASCRLSTST